MACLGTEESLYQCSANEIGSHNCAHSEDAGVICTSKQCLYHDRPQLVIMKLLFSHDLTTVLM